MAMGQSPAVLRDIHTLFHDGTSNGVTDAQLLDRFRARSDLNSSEAAFAGLLARHGPMVLGVCRRALRNPDDVEDAFQATFLILVRKADTVRVEDSLGRWLYGVSRRVSVRAKLAEARRSARQVPGIELAAAPDEDADSDELRDVLDEEIGRLPEKFRSAVVLCELEGFGVDEASRRLGCAVGTVKSRLSRAREKLRSRLIRRGVAPTAWALYAQSTSAAVPAKLMETTINAAIAYADGVIPPAVTLLIQGVLRAMLLKKVSIIAVTVVASLALATGAGVFARQTGGLPNDDQRGGQGSENRAGGENQLSNTARSSGALLEGSNEQKDEALERIELLRLDVELLEGEVEARKQAINFTSQNLIQMRVSGHNRSTNELLPPDTRRAEVESLEKELSGLRREWLIKKKELRQKQSELDELSMNDLQERRRRAAELKAKERTGKDQRSVNRKNAERIQPATPDAPGISPILEKRLSDIEGKLDNVLKAIADLKHERGE
jgi:RNA polymerase sigma factor (sigma-70 family)